MMKESKDRWEETDEVDDDKGIEAFQQKPLASQRTGGVLEDLPFHGMAGISG